MVRFKLKHFILIFMFFLYSFLTQSCNNDLWGLFSSTDIDERLQERNNFTFLNTQPPLSIGSGNYSFIVLTDTHIEGGNANGLEKLPAIVSADSSIKFVVVVGDVTQNGAKEDIDKFIEIAKSLSVPIYPVIGNHDIYFGNWPVWKENIGSTSYKISEGNAALFMLDSANAFYGKQQLDWLEGEMKLTNRDVFVFSHHNLFTEGLVNLQQTSSNYERARLTSILRNKCHIMFMGHSHKMQHNKVGGVEYIVIEDFKKTQTYCLVSVSSTGVIYEFKKL